MAEDFGFVPDPPKKDKEEDFGFTPDDPASQTKREYVEKGGKPEDVYSPERLQTLVEQGPAALIAEPPMRREDGSIAGPTIPTKEALDKGLIEKRAEPAVEKAMAQGVETVSSGFDKEKGVGFAVGRDKQGEVVRVEEKPDDFGFVPDPKPKSSTPDFVPDEKLTPSQSAVARESLGRFAKGALVTGPAAIARAYGLVESAAGIPIQGEPYNFESTAGARIARGLEQAGERLYPTIPEAQGSFIPEVAGGLGQVSTIVAGGPIARAAGIPASVAPRAVAAGTGVVLGAGEGAQRASQAGAKPEEILTAGFLNGVTGLSEVFPAEKWIEKIDKATAGKFSRDVRRYFIEAGVEAGTEALQEAFQTTMGNLIAKGQYRPEQDVLEGAGKAALVGGTVGAIASGVIGGFGLSQARRNQNVATTEPRAEAIQPDVRPQAEVQPEVQAQPQQEGLQPFTEFQRPEEQAPRSGIETKVSDKDGNPLTVFHGTTQRFDKFKDGRIWFSADRNFAEIYKQDQPDGDVKELNVVIKNPKTFSSDNVGRSQWVETTDAGLKRDGFDGVLFLKPDGSIDDGYAFKGDQILIREPKKPTPESPAAQERVTSQETPVNNQPKIPLEDFEELLKNHDWQFENADDSYWIAKGEKELLKIRDAVLSGGDQYKKLYDQYRPKSVESIFDREARLQRIYPTPSELPTSKPQAVKTYQKYSKAPTRESVVLSAGEKARLTRLDTIEGDIKRLKENDPDQTPYYDERLNQIQSERDNIIRKAERPTKALAEDILQPDETGYDIIDFIQEQGGILSKKRATEQKNISLYGKKGGPSLKRVAGSTQPAEYDGMPDLRGPYTGLMKGSMPVDEMAQMAYDNLGVGDGTSGGLWQAVGKAIDSRRKTREYNQGLRQTESQRQAFRSALFRPKVGDISYQASNLQQGDIIRRGNEDFRVMEIDPETFDLTIQGPTRYGKRVVKSDAFIFADRAFRGSEPLRGVQVRKGGKASVTPSTRTAQTKKEDIRQELKTRLDDFRRTFQDKFVDVENLQKRVAEKEGSIPDYANIKQAEELYHGRVGEQLTDFDENQARPIIEDLGKSGISAEVFDKYATAKHAKERNAVIAQRFPNDPAKQDGGSGMTNAEADRVLRSEISQADQAKLEPIRQRLLEVNRQGLRNRYEAGLISRDTYELLTQRYKDYVPLMGRETGLAEDETGETMRTAGTGSGFDVRGSDIIMAEGRTTKASDIIAYSFQQYMDSVVRAEKNRVMQTAQQFAINYPNNGVIELLQEGEIGNSQAPDIIAFKDNGRVRYLRINDPKLADIMKNRASPVLGSFVGGLASLNRYFAFINTQASPEFVISNFARDLQTALVNINQNDAKGLATDLVKNIRPSLAATFRAELGTPEANNRMDLFYNEFRREGGRMTFFGLKDFATLQKQIQKEVARGGSNSATRVFGKALDFVGKANSAVENATRLATYATLRERGYTPKQSAYAARNITVNFTRKGTAGPLLNSFYLFFNANIQGSARIIQALATSKKAQKIMLGVMAFGFFRDILNRIMGGDDETGVPFYDKIPEFTRRQNFVLMNPLRQGTGEYFKFPMPYGYSVFDYAGQLMASVMPREILGGGMKPSKAAFRLSMAALDNFNPIGGSYSLLQAISPTITTPLVDLALNMDFSGRPIMPTPNPFDPTPPPDSQRYWNNVSPVSKWVTEKINELTGGSKARAGAVDVSPETLDYAVEFLSGAVGKFGERLVTLPFRGIAAAQGDLPLEDLVGEIPMYRKLSGRVPSYVDISRYQEMRSEVLKIAEELKIAQQEGERAKAIEISREARPELRMVPLIKSTEQRLKELRSERRKLQETYKRTDSEAVLNRIRANRERQKELMIKALDRYNSSVDDKM